MLNLLKFSLHGSEEVLQKH